MADALTSYLITRQAKVIEERRDLSPSAALRTRRPAQLADSQAAPATFIDDSQADRQADSAILH